MPRKKPLIPLDKNQRYTIEEANDYLRQSRAKTYKDIAAGRLKTIKMAAAATCPGGL